MATFFPLIFVNGQKFWSLKFKSSNDSIYEIRDKNITIQITLPGIFARSTWNLDTSVSITDNNDGIVSNSTYYRKILEKVLKIQKNDSGPFVHL